MSNEIIGILNTDHSQEIIDKITTDLSHKGVVLKPEHSAKSNLAHHLMFYGMGNKLYTVVHLELPQEDLSPEQIQEKASEIVREVEDKMRRGW